jgi:hypothetical protein
VNGYHLLVNAAMWLGLSESLSNTVLNRRLKKSDGCRLSWIAVEADDELLTHNWTPAIISKM